jgi:hypothetical protein
MNFKIRCVYQSLFLSPIESKNVPGLHVRKQHSTKYKNPKNSHLFKVKLDIMLKTIFISQILLQLISNARPVEHTSERQKIADRMREGFLTVSLKDLLVLPRLLRREFR